MTLSRFVAERVEDALLVSPEPNRAAVDAMRVRSQQVLRPAGALAELDQIAIWFAGWRRKLVPLDRAQVLVFAGDHGVARRGVSAYPTEVTAAMKAAIENAQATSTALAAANNASLSLVDVGVGVPTNDLTEADALDVDRFLDSWEAGERAVRDGDPCDVLILGELGIGNTTSAAAVAAGVIGGAGADWVGRGTGVDDAGLVRKAEAVDAGLSRLGDRRTDPVEVLAALGGAELVAMAGAAVEARRLSIPLILDGFIATSALLPLHALSACFLDHAVAGHLSGEAGHQRILEWLGMKSILQLDMRLGEATGALMALPIVRAAVAGVLDVATFAEAGVPGPGD